MKEATITPFAKPLYVMTKPVGAVCNLACDYCYYLEKAKLYGHDSDIPPGRASLSDVP